MIKQTSKAPTYFLVKSIATNNNSNKNDKHGKIRQKQWGQADLKLGDVIKLLTGCFRLGDLKTAFLEGDMSDADDKKEPDKIIREEMFLAEATATAKAQS